jgi:diaminopimelate decarboxylase
MTHDKILEEEVSPILQRTLSEEGLLEENDTAVILHDLSALQSRVNRLIEVFPSNTLHAVAIKANPLTKILSLLREAGVGLEAASLPELYLAERAGFPPKKLVFDSPAKTAAELEYALKAGVHINADNLQELERIACLWESMATESTIGIRINPQVGVGTISSTSVAATYSKFGVPLEEGRESLEQAFFSYDWLRGVHLHIGSQGCEVAMLVEGVRRVLEFAEGINGLFRDRGEERRIDVFDIGGGLPVSYHRDQIAPTIEEYCDELQRRCPRLFGGGYRLITEFGRYVHANAGWTASRVEYVKEGVDVDTAVIHVGADQFLRECYRPEDWCHVLSVFDAEGRPKQGKAPRPYVVAGPLCFAGDVIAREIQLPKIEVGDYIVVHDTGAYTLSMWSRYNSRQIPKVIGYWNGGDSFEVVRQRETLEMLWDFWS